MFEYFSIIFPGMQIARPLMIVITSLVNKKWQAVTERMFRVPEMLLGSVTALAGPTWNMPPVTTCDLGIC